MSSCLGLYIEENLIKYAKVSKEKDLIKVESFGIKFYDRIGEAIDQIVAETFSYKIPITINLSEETYQYFYFFSLLNKNDLKKAIETEFESYCHDKGFNRNALETRYALVEDIQEKEKIKAIYISTSKTQINSRIQEFNNNSISNITSLPLAITNLAEYSSKENVLIVNIEENTTVTTIMDNRVYNIDKIEQGTKTILDSINEKENSYSKAYEICKNTTIYTMEGKEILEEEENVYLEDIMPTLYQIVQSVQEIVNNSLENIDRIYITGTGAVINNIDLYFQEYFKNVKCSILKPYFISETVKINIRDYIEVNSAIALAMQGLGYGIRNINFKKPSFSDNLPDWLTMEIGTKTKKNSKSNFSFDLKGTFDTTERWLLRTIITVFSFIIIYSAITMFLKIQTDNKLTEVAQVRDHTESQMALVDKDSQTLNNKTTDYQKMTENLKSYSNSLSENARNKNVIPKLLSEIMYTIPEGVTITSIENTTDRHIVINAQAEKYELLGYFKGNIITEGILSPSTVISTSGIKQDGVIKIVIEGDLP